MTPLLLTWFFNVANRVSLNIYDAKGVLVKTLYEQTTDGQATHPLVWLGEGSADYNNGELVKDGKYLVKTVAIDKVGNEAQSAQEIILDNLPPEVSVPTLTLIPQIPPNPPLPKGEETYVKITGIVNVKGIALDPGISNPNDFKWYKLYYREGGGLDFNLNENNPLF